MAPFKRSLAFDGPALVGDGDDGRPRRRAEARSADDLPRALPRDGRGLVDVDAGVGIAVERDVGGASPAGVLNRPLIVRLGLVFGISAAAADPGQLELVLSGAVNDERGSADGHDGRCRRGPLGPACEPLSPLAARNVMPVCPAGVVKVEL